MLHTVATTLCSLNQRKQMHYHQGTNINKGVSRYDNNGNNGNNNDGNMSDSDN